MTAEEPVPDAHTDIRKLERELIQLREQERERARAAEALRNSEQRYRALYNNTPVMMHSIDDSGRLVSVNDYWLKTMGYRRNEVLGRPVTEFLTEDSRRHTVAFSIPELRREGAVKDLEVQLVRKSGEIIDVLVSAIAEYDRHGTIERSLAFLVDVTARKRAADAIAASRERLSKIFNLSNDAGFVLDTEHDAIRDVNVRACELLGYTRDELLKLPISAVHPDEMPRLMAFTTSVLERGGGWTDELSCVAKSGQKIPAEISASAVEIDGNRRVVAWVRDISERKRAETALKESEEQFRLLVERAADAFYVLEPDGRIVDVNNRACETTGYTREELLRLPAWEVSLGLDSKTLRHNFVQMAAAGPITVGGYHRRKDGTTFPVEVRAGRVEVRGQPRILALVRDITERVQAEQERRRLQARLSRILQSAMDAIVTIDTDGQIRLFNRAAESVFRCPAAEAIGTSIDRFLSEDLRKLVREHAEAGTGSVWVPKSRLAVRADGEMFPIEATVSTAEADGEHLCTIILRDIDERERAEAQLRKLSEERVYLQEEIQGEHNFGEMVGGSAAIAEVVRLIEQVAGTGSTVLITGETGTGKELVARAIHRAGDRKDRVLVRVNCAALSAGLIESELFGHEKGAFTGAVSRRMGRFELADGGTIFLDEIAELPAELQAKLLRVLQGGEFERVGGTKTIRVDVRVIAATNRDLDQAVQKGRFRSDLYYRLKVFPIHVPPLRDRPEDIPLLVSFFTQQHAARMGKRIETIPQNVLRRLQAYAWPGNVRELENVIERAVIISTGRELDLGLWQRDPEVPGETAKLRTLDEVQRAHIIHVLEGTGWRVSGPQGAAKILGLKPTTLSSRMKKLGIERPRRN